MDGPVQGVMHFDHFFVQAMFELVNIVYFLLHRVRPTLVQRRANDEVLL